MGATKALKSRLATSQRTTLTTVAQLNAWDLLRTRTLLVTKDGLEQILALTRSERPWINTNIIIKPLITEKSTHKQSTRNEYAFQVTQNATKPEIRKAVEKLYSVKVLDVRTIIRKGKPRRTRYKMIHTSNTKRAIVVLDENSKIDLVLGEVVASCDLAVNAVD